MNNNNQHSQDSIASNKINGARKILFIDRDGVLVKEPPITYQLDSFDQLEFYPNIFKYLG